LKLDKNIVLIGFISCGRGCIGKDLAKELEAFFVDSKSLINSYDDIAEDELKSLYDKTKEWLKYTKNSIISLDENIAVTDEISKLGNIVYIRKEFEDLEIDISKEEFEERDSIFKAKADLIFDASKLAKDVILRDILWIDFETI
jgi:shikimate kinase